MSKTAIDPAKELATIKYLIRLVQRVTEIRAIADHTQAIAAFNALYAKIYEPKAWDQFKYIPVVAQQAGELISDLKKDLTLAVPIKPIEPADLSDLLSKIDVECDRLHTTQMQEALNRFGKSRQALSESELREWLQELKEIPNPILRENIQAIAAPIPQSPITEDNAPLLAKILDLRTQLEFDKGDVVHFYAGKIGKAPNFGSSTELKVLIGLLEVEIGDREAAKDSGDQEGEFF